MNLLFIGEWKVFGGPSPKADKADLRGPQRNGESLSSSSAALICHRQYQVARGLNGVLDGRLKVS